MGTYQKMKQAEKQVKYWENELSQKDMKTEYLRTHFEGQLESSKREYHAEKFAYTATITLMVFTILSMIGIGLVYLKNQGVFN